MQYSNIWKLSWKNTDYDYDKMMDDFRDYKFNGMFLEKESVDININLMKNDIVFISCNNKRLMRCIILETNISCINENIYMKNITGENKFFCNHCLLKIQQIYKDPVFMKTSNKLWELN